jgi:hypothetical protein
MHAQWVWIALESSAKGANAPIGLAVRHSEPSVHTGSVQVSKRNAGEYCAGGRSSVRRQVLVYRLGGNPAFGKAASGLKTRGSMEPPDPPPSSGGAVVRTELR